MDIHKNILFGLIFCFLLPQLVTAQERPVLEKPNFMFQVWSHDDGLPATSIHSVTSTSEGYLWFATGEGLVRFDGDQFSVFNASNTREITYKIFNSLTSDSDGSIWAANRNELIRIQNGEFHRIPFPDEFRSHQIFSIERHTNGTVWVGSSGDGILTYKDGEFASYKSEDGLPGNDVTDIAISDDGRVWFSTRTGIGYFMNETVFILDHYPELIDLDARELLVDSQNRLWIGTAREGIYRVDFENDELVNLSNEQGLAGNMVNSLLEESSGVVWAGTSGDGLFRIESDNIAHYDVLDGLASNMIFSLYQSHDEIIWIGTAGAGLTKIRETSVRSLNMNDGLSSNMILPIYQQTNGDIWIGTGGRGVNRISDGVITQFTTTSGLTDNLVYSIFGRDNGSVWVGTANGLNRIQNDEIQTYFVSDGLVQNSIHAIKEDSRGRLWLAFSGGGLQTYENGEFQTVEVPPRFRDATLSSIHEDSEENVWVGSHGFGALKISNDSIRVYDEDSGLPDGLVLDFYEDEEMVMWIGTRDGLVRIEDDEIEIFTREDGLEHNDFFRILKDDNNIFWTCSNWGVQSFSKDNIDRYRSGEISAIPSFLLTINDGMPSRECNGGVSPAGWVMQNGEFWFPTVGGVAMFNPAEIEYDMAPPPVLIENLISGEDIYQRYDEPVMEAGTRNFEIKYTALEFKNPGRVRFRYRLKNYDDDWIDAGSRRTAYYTGLWPGDYEFEVAASKPGGEWSVSTATMAFTIEPHFYQTKTFLFFSFLLLFFAGVGVQRFIRIKGDQKELQKLVDIRTKELTEEISEHKSTEKELEKSLAEKTVLLKEIHHRVKNNLAIISALFQLQLYKTDNKEAVNLLTDSQNRIKSIAMIHEMLYQNELFSSIEMSDYIRKLVENIRETIQQEAEISVEYDLEKIRLGINQAIPCGLMTNEIITNSFKHAFPEKREGAIRVELMKDGENVSLTISDNGVGLDEDIESSDSTGMELIRTLCTQLKGSVSVKSDKGVAFTITFKEQMLKSPYHNTF